MKTNVEGSGRFLNRRVVAGALLTGASLGIQILAPLVWPKLDHAIGMTLVALCVVALLAGVALLWLGHRQQKAETARRWRIVGMGQGWIEARVRSNSGDQVVVSWNEGSGADQISLWVTFHKRFTPRQSEIVEMTVDVDGNSFEWDLPDPGEREFALDGKTWREVEAIKTMLAVMREGTTLVISVPTLHLSAQFTLNDAFDALQGAASLGEGTQENTA